MENVPACSHPFVAPLLAVLLLLAVVPARAQQGPTTTYRGVEVVAGSVVVQWEGGGPHGKRAAARTAGAREALGARVTVRLARSGIEEWAVETDVETALAQLDGLPGVRAVPNVVIPTPRPVGRRAVHGADDPLWSRLWGLENDGTGLGGAAVAGVDVAARAAWGAAGEGEGAVVVMLDTGLDYTHPDLAANVWVNPGEDLNGDGVVQGPEINGVDDDGNGYVDDVHGWNARTDGWDVRDEQGHGTHVAGTVGAVGGNGLGVVGLAPQVRLIGVDAVGGDLVDLLEAYEYVSILLDRGVPVAAVNQSWGFAAPGLPRFDPDLREIAEMIRSYALDHAEHGVVWTCSAGNDAADNDASPGFRLPSGVQAPNVVAVGAHDAAGRPADFSNTGAYTVDLGAPGVDVLSTVPGARYAAFDGTSMAAPFAAAAMALAATRYPDESAVDRVVRVLAAARAAAPYYHGLWRTGGRLDAHRLVAPRASGLTGLVVPRGVGLVHRATGEDEGVTALGFVNATDAALTVTGARLSGTHADAFRLLDDGGTAAVVPPDGAFGLPVAFRPLPDAAHGRFEATATISTSAGDVEIALRGVDRQPAVAVLTPDRADVGAVPVGTPVRGTATLANRGGAPLAFSVTQSLVRDHEHMSAQVAARRRDARVPASPHGAVIAAPPAGAELQRVARAVLARLAPMTPLPLGLDEETDEAGLATLYHERFEDAAHVDSTWTVLDQGALDFDRPSGAVWHRAALDAAAADHGLLAGDLDGLLAPATWTAAVSPAFDFGALPVGRRPYYLAFDYVAHLDAYHHRVYVYATAGGAYQGLLAHTGTSMAADGRARELLVDVGHLAGRRDVRLHFVAYYDEAPPTGFGVSIDDVRLVTGEAAFFAADYSGLVAPGEARDIELTVRTGALAPGDYTLVTTLETPAANTFGLEHRLHFGIAEAALGLHPERAVLDQPFAASGTDTASFVIDGGGPALPFEAVTHLHRLGDTRAVVRPAAAHVSPHRGVLPADGPQRFVLALDAATLAPGRYEARTRVAVEVGDTVRVLAQHTLFEVAAPTASGREAVPTRLVLEANYPNPFSESTTIRFGLSEARAVTLRVYDVLGRCVFTAHDGTVLPAGRHAVTLGAGTLAPGLYAYRLEATAPDGRRVALPARTMTRVR